MSSKDAGQSTQVDDEVVMQSAVDTSYSKDSSSAL